MTHPRLLDLIRADNEPNLGASLLRLAQLAQAVHRYEAAQARRLACNDADADPPAIPGRPAPADDAGTDAGTDAGLAKLRRGGSSTHTEVRR